MSLRRAVAFAVLLLAPGAAAAGDEHGGPPNMAQMSFLAGDWAETKDGRTVEEHWVGPVGGIMAGMTIVYTAEPGAKTTLEAMSVEIRDGKFVFVARPEGQGETVFVLKEADNGYAVFENPAHDFPQRVIYWDKGTGAVGARIEGVVSGQTRAVEWTFSPR